MNSRGFLIVVLSTAVLLFTWACRSNKRINNSDEPLEDTSIATDTVRIKSDQLEYEIIIIEPGFNNWLYGTAQPEGYYEQSFLEARNSLFVREWNLRVMQPDRYNPNLYVLRIDYDPRINYGYTLNYKLYNYFIYFQLKHKEQLTEFVPRI